MSDAPNATDPFLSQAERHLVEIGYRDPPEHRRRKLDRGPDLRAYLGALALTPLVIGGLGYPTMILPMAMLVGLPAHVLIGGPVGWAALRLTEPQSLGRRIGVSALVGLAAAPVAAVLLAAIWGRGAFDLDEVAGFARLTLVFAPVNAVAVVLVYSALAQWLRGPARSAPAGRAEAVRAPLGGR